MSTIKLTKKQAQEIEVALQKTKNLHLIYCAKCQAVHPWLGDVFECPNKEEWVITDGTGWLVEKNKSGSMTTVLAAALVFPSETDARLTAMYYESTKGSLKAVTLASQREKVNKTVPK